MGLFDLFKKKKQEELPEEERRVNLIWELWENGKAESPYAELMTYQSEINNGGHSQYFFNVGNTGDLKKEMETLSQVLPPALKDNLSAAYKAYLLLEENEDDEQAEEQMEQCDDTFYEHESDINDTLAEYASRIEL